MPRLKPYVSMRARNCIFSRFLIFLISWFMPAQYWKVKIWGNFRKFFWSFYTLSWWIKMRNGGTYPTFPLLLMLNHYFFFVWSKLAQFGERSRQASQRLPFQQYKRPSQRGTPSQMKRKQKGWDFFGTEISCVFLNPEKEKRKLSWCS